MSLESIIGLAGCVVCAAVAFVAILRADRGLAVWLCAAGLISLGAESFLTALIENETTPRLLAVLHEWRLSAMSLSAAAWLLFSFRYARGNARDFFRDPGTVLGLLCLVPAVWGMWPGSDVVVSLTIHTPGAAPKAQFGWPGLAINLACLLASLVTLMGIEHTFRAAVGTMRWRIKFVVLGLTLIFGVRVFTSSQALLYNSLNMTFMAVDACAVLFGSALIGFSLLRARLSEAEIYPSRAVLHKSLAAVLGGIYLAMVGLVSKVLASLGQHYFVPAVAFFILVGVVGLSVVLLSDRAQQRLRIFVSRHFRRPVHDYRQVWQSFAERTGYVTNPAEYCRRVVNLVSETLGTLSVSLWLVEDGGRSVRLGASTALSQEMGEERSAAWRNENSSGMAVPAREGPFDLDEYEAECASALKRLAEDHFEKGGGRICVPLFSAGELQGLMMVSDRVAGVEISAEDQDLLKCMSVQVASRLRGIRLSDQLVQAKQMEAFQSMSAFLVHDLKNTASLLSLMLQNMASHFGDPAFREDALRGLSKSVAHIKDLLGRLTTLRQGLEIRKTEVDVNEVVESALAGLAGFSGLQIEKQLASVARTAADRDQLGKVFANLLLNAKEAAGDAGQIRVQTRQDNGWLTVGIEDNGCGMNPEFIRNSLFKPFQTTKPQGLGIGMFQSKMIVEAHQGRIEVESEPGKGTRFRVVLPVQPLSS